MSDSSSDRKLDFEKVDCLGGIPEKKNSKTRQRSRQEKGGWGVTLGYINGLCPAGK